MAGAIAARGNPHPRNSPATWKRKRSRGTTQTTRLRLLSRNSTALRNNGATTRMNTRAWRRNLAPLPPLLRHTKTPAMPNRTESPAKNIITATKKGTGARSPINTTRRRAAIEGGWKEKSPVWRVPYRNRRNRTRGPPRMNVRWKRRRKKRKVGVYIRISENALIVVTALIFFVVFCFFPQGDRSYRKTLCPRRRTTTLRPLPCPLNRS